MVQARFFRKIAELRHEYLRTPELPFAEVLRQEQLLKWLGEGRGTWFVALWRGDRNGW